MTDLTITSEPAAQRLADETRRLQQRVNALKSIVRFSDLRDEIEAKELETTTNGMPESLRRLREKGYRFQSSLEQTAIRLKDEWMTLRPLLRATLEAHAMILGAKFNALMLAIVQLTQLVSDPQKAEPLLVCARASVADLESTSRLAIRAARNPFAAYKRKVNDFVTSLQQLEWMLTQVHEAKFELQANEAAVMGARATWIKGDEDQPEGVLYLTDQRIVFERKQSFATKKFLFFNNKAELVHQLLLDASVETIEEIKASKRGFFRREDHLEITFGPGTSVSAAHFWLHGQDSVSWAELVESTKIGNVA